MKDPTPLVFQLQEFIRYFICKIILSSFGLSKEVAFVNDDNNSDSTQIQTCMDPNVPMEVGIPTSKKLCNKFR